MTFLKITSRPWRNGLTLPEFRGRAIRIWTGRSVPDTISIERHTNNKSLLDVLQIPQNVVNITRAEIKQRIFDHAKELKTIGFRPYGHWGFYRSAEETITHAAKGLESSGFFQGILHPIMMRLGPRAKVLEPIGGVKAQAHLLSGDGPSYTNLMKTYPSYQSLVFSGLDLSHMDFSDLHFSHCYFNGAILNGTVWQGAEFFDCEFCFCKADGADFRRSHFYNNSSLGHSQWARANFDNAFIQGSNSIKGVTEHPAGQIIVPPKTKFKTEFDQFSRGGSRLLSEADLPYADSESKRDVYNHYIGGES